MAFDEVERKPNFTCDWACVVLYSIVLSSMMSMIGLMRSLFILYVHEHDRLGFGMLTVETAVIHLFILIVPIATE